MNKHREKPKRYSLKYVANSCGVSPSTLTKWIHSIPRSNAEHSSRWGASFSESDLQELSDIARLIGDGVSLKEVAKQFKARRKKALAQIRSMRAGATRAGKQTPLDTTSILSAGSIADICHVHISTAKRYLKTGKAPYTAAMLIELYQNGRVLPDSWKYCFVNARGNLEIYQVGEVEENDIVNIQWARELNDARIRSLEYELRKSQERVRDLEKHLDNARTELGEMPAAND